MQEKLDSFHVLGASSLIASVAGLAALLRSKQPLTYRNVIAAVLYNAVAGLLIALLWYKKFGGEDGDLFFLMGISGMAGVGGISLLDFAVQALKSKGIVIQLPGGEKNEESEKSE